jgi:protein-tyrosine phosphatase
VLLGAEVHFDELNVLAPNDFQSLAIEGTNLVLTELPFYREWENGLLDKLSEQATRAGVVPVLAHVERYDAVHKHPKLLSEFVRRGWLLQVNASSFCDKHNASLVIAMLKHGLIHCLGTDAHNLTDRAPDYSDCQDRIERIGLKKEWTVVQTTMQQLLDGKKLSPCQNCVHRFGKLYF